MHAYGVVTVSSFEKRKENCESRTYSILFTSTPAIYAKNHSTDIRLHLPDKALKQTTF